MNSLCFYVSIVCCMVVTEQSGTAYTKPKLSEPPIPNSHPRYWQDSVRQLHLQSKNNWYIAITKDGHVSGSREKGESAVLIMTSGINKTVAMKGRHANKFLCVNNDSKVYASDTPNERHCYFVEEYNTNDYNMYRHSFHRRGDRKVYLAIDDDGTIRLGNSTDNMRIYFLPLEPKKDSVSTHSSLVTTTTTVATTTLSTSTVPPVKRRLERTRKRRRRWCKLLIRGRLEKKPDKYKDRCKHDCEILHKMLDNPKRYKRKCEKQRKKRRNRNRKKRGRGRGRGSRGRRPTRHDHDNKKRHRHHRGRGRVRQRTVKTASSQTHNDSVT
ncbi:uncharacterized protein [Haliotis asinina]|uniref:uncharacterized protein n=1 Tax=Haliotis asinina TaxID=109174 RepID=UPI003531BA38